MIKIKIRVQDEDKFGVVLQLLKTKVRQELYTITNLYLEDADTIAYLLEYAHPRFINMLLLKIQDIADIIELEILYAFVYNKQEAYSDIETASNRCPLYNKLC